MTGNFLTLASTAGVIWGIFQHWNSGASWNFAIWSGLLLIGVIFYHQAERSTSRTHSHPTNKISPGSSKTATNGRKTKSKK